MKKIPAYLMASLLLVVGCVQDDLSWRDQLKAEKERQDQMASTLEKLQKSDTPFMLVMVDAPTDTTTKGLDFFSRFRVNPSGVALTKEMIALDCVSSKRFYSTPPRTKASYVSSSQSFSLKDLAADKNAEGEPLEGQYLATLTSATEETVWDEARMAFVGAYVDQEGKTQYVSSDLFHTVMMPLPHEGLDPWMYPHASFNIKQNQQDTLGSIYMPLDGKVFSSTDERETRFYSAKNLVGASFKLDEGCTAPVRLTMNEKDHYLRFIPDTTGNETWRQFRDTTVFQRLDVTGTLVLKDRWNGESHLPIKMSWYNQRQLTVNLEVSAEDIVSNYTVDLSEELKRLGLDMEDMAACYRALPGTGGEGDGDKEGLLAITFANSSGLVHLDHAILQLNDTPIPGRTYSAKQGVFFGIFLTNTKLDSDAVPCVSVDLRVNVTIKDEPVENLAEKLVGTWDEMQVDGKNVPTSRKKTITVLSATEAYSDVPLDPAASPEIRWNRQRTPLDVTIDGDVVTFKEHDTNNSIRLKVKVVDNVQLLFYPLEAGSTTPSPAAGISFWERVKTQPDYSQKIQKLWQCTDEIIRTGISAQKYRDTRIAFNADRTFDLYKLEKTGLWKRVEDRSGTQYVLDNANLGIRWQEAGEAMTYEWWTIKSMGDNTMSWHSVCESGSIVGFHNLKWREVVYPTQEEIAQAFLGKWCVDRINKQSIPTNESTILTILSTTKASISTSLYPHAEADLALDGHVITLTHRLDAHNTIVTRIAVAGISESFIEGAAQKTDYVDGEPVKTYPEYYIQYKKVEHFFEQDILGAWEGRSSGKDTYGDDKPHRWEFKADGTYVYYVQDGNMWVPGSNTLNQYFVDGDRLCMHWIDGAKEYYEWWHIALLEGVNMTWSAVREKESGEKYTSIYTMKRIN